MKAAAVCHPLATSPPKNEAWPSRSLRWKGCRSNSSANRMISGPESVNVPRKCCCPLVKSSRYFNDCLSWGRFRVQSRAPVRSYGRQEPFLDVSQGSEVVHLQALRVVAGAGLLFKQEEEFHQRQ